MARALLRREDLRKIGGRIRYFRMIRKRSQSWLGQKLGVTFQQIQKYENGNNRCSAPALELIAKALDVPIHEFFERDNARSLALSETVLLVDTSPLLRLLRAARAIKQPRKLEIVIAMAEELGLEAV